MAHGAGLAGGFLEGFLGAYSQARREDQERALRTAATQQQGERDAQGRQYQQALLKLRKEAAGREEARLKIAKADAGYREQRFYKEMTAPAKPPLPKKETPAQTRAAKHKYFEKRERFKDELKPQKEEKPRKYPLTRGASNRLERKDLELTQKIDSSNMAAQKLIRTNKTTAETGEYTGWTKEDILTEFKKLLARRNLIRQQEQANQPFPPHTKPSQAKPPQAKQGIKQPTKKKKRTNQDIWDAMR